MFLMTSFTALSICRRRSSSRLRISSSRDLSKSRNISPCSWRCRNSSSFCLMKRFSLKHSPRKVLLELALEKFWYSGLFRPCEGTWWRHQMEIFSALLALCAGNSPVTGEFPSQKPVTWSFDVFFDMRLNKRFSKQSWGCWFETPSRALWRHCNVSVY